MGRRRARRLPGGVRQRVTVYTTAFLVGLGIGSVYALVAMGYALVYSSVGVFNLAQGDLVTLGGLLTATFVVTLRWPALAAVFPVVAIVAVFSVVLQRVTIAPFSNKGPTSFGWFIATLGASVAIENGAQILWGSNPVPVPSLTSLQHVGIAGAPIETEYLIVFGLAVVATVAIWYCQSRTLLGKIWAATAEDPVGAQVRGINTARVGLVAFVIAAVISALAGFVTVPITGAIWNAGASLTLYAFAAVCIGGFGSPVGPLAGGLIVGVAQSESTVTIPAGYQSSVALGLLLLVLLIKPSGLFGQRLERVV
jgi:branched-chain amino acid transport system permease protein